MVSQVVENTLLFSNVVTFLCSIDIDNWGIEELQQMHYSYQRN